MVVRLVARVTWCACAALSLSGCGGSGSGGQQTGPYECQASAIVLTGFQGSCDTRTAGTPSAQCQEWWGSATTDVQAICVQAGGAFDAVNRCPADNRVLRCTVSESTLKIVHSYYAPSYSEAEAAAECTALSGRCLTGSGGE